MSLRNRNYEITEARTIKDVFDDYFTRFRNDNWKVSTGLKINHVTSPSGDIRLWFKPESIHYTIGNKHSFAGARSLLIHNIKTVPYEGLMVVIKNLITGENESENQSYRI